MTTNKQGSMYTMHKVLHFLTHAHVIVPINTDEWQLVTDDHAAVCPETMQYISSIKYKFQSLIKLTGPSGNPNCLEDLRLAKKVMNEIKTKSKTKGDNNMPSSVDDKDKDNASTSYDNENNNDNNNNDYKANDYNDGYNNGYNVNDNCNDNDKKNNNKNDNKDNNDNNDNNNKKTTTTMATTTTKCRKQGCCSKMWQQQQQQPYQYLWRQQSTLHPRYLSLLKRQARPM